MGKYAGFQSVQMTKPKKSKFDLSHEKRMSVAGAELVPVLVAECVPSDNFNGSSEILTRLAPLLAPIYEQVNVYVHYFFVPNRLLWEEWELFITGGRLGVGVEPVDAPIPPYFDIKAAYDELPLCWAKHSLADYLGVPLFTTFPGGGVGLANFANCTVDAMPFIAYQMIWENYYMDRNFDSTVIEPELSGDVSSSATTLMVLRKRLYKKEYFTSALPFTQRGEEVLLPVDVRVDSARKVIDGSVPGGTYPGNVAYDNLGDLVAPDNLNAPIYLEGSNAASTINDFRSAYALQVWLERNAVGGSRYTENTQAHFGVRPQDSRLQRPEYIGGGRISVKISEVVATAYSTNDIEDYFPLGNMAGHGVSFGNTNKFNYFCVEHGFIMGILSIMTPPSFHQGLPRMFRRKTFLDYPWPTFAKLGEQQVDNAELYANHTNLTEDAEGNLPLFGYQSRYADWKYIANTNHGEFHDTLLFWTGTLQFADTPVLGLDFLTPVADNYNRWFAVDNAYNAHFWLYVHNRVYVSRPLPYFGTPNTLGFV